MKNRIPQFSKFETALKPHELEKIIDMKKMRLDDIFPTVYRLLHSDKQLKTRKNARHHSLCATLFSKLLLNREESSKVFNMAKLRLIHSFPTVYT